MKIIYENCGVKNYIYGRKIIAVIDATFAVANRKPEKIQAFTGFEPLASVIPVQRPYQLS